jgi:hypothetical protein
VAPADGDRLADQVELLRYRVDDLTRRVVVLTINLMSWIAVALIAVALWLPVYREVDVTEPGWVNLYGLIGAAGEAENGAVQWAGVLTLIVFLGCGALCIVLAFGGSRPTANATMVAAAVALVLWVILTIVVGVSGGGGSIRFLGYGNTFRVVVGPVAAAAVFAAGAVCRSLETEAGSRP